MEPPVGQGHDVLAELALQVAAGVGTGHGDDVALDRRHPALPLEAVVLGGQVVDGSDMAPSLVSSRARPTPPPTERWLTSASPPSR